MPEAHFGVTFDVVCLPDKAKKQMNEIRNMYIKRGEESFTHNDVLVRALDALYQIESVQQRAFDLKKEKVNGNGNQQQQPGAGPR